MYKWWTLRFDDCCCVAFEQILSFSKVVSVFLSVFLKRKSWLVVRRSCAASMLRPYWQEAAELVCKKLKMLYFIECPVAILLWLCDNLWNCFRFVVAECCECWMSEFSVKCLLTSNQLNVKSLSNKDILLVLKHITFLSTTNRWSPRSKLVWQVVFTANDQHHKII